jgi:hypothetical protein
MSSSRVFSFARVLLTAASGAWASLAPRQDAHVRAGPWTGTPQETMDEEGNGNIA